MRRVLVTSALPYANGPIHLGHLVEYIQTDIWVRAARMSGRRAVYICADDTHGTGIMLRARQEGRTEQALIAEIHAQHLAEFAAFDVAFDHYGSTHSDENQVLAGQIWAAFRTEGLIKEVMVSQLFDPEEKIFLADRFVRGTCPNCKSPDQYGDNCDKCGATYAATELGSPKSTLSGTSPELREAPHLLIDLEAYRPWLTEWTQTDDRMPRETANYILKFFLDKPLRPWDVSRPAPYFGFEIPDAPGHFFYVWFDAPIGYLASTQQWCSAHGERLDDWLRSEEGEVVHVIGKDIVKFHTLFWPVMLKLGGFTLPTRIQVHGFLTVNGEKMSKSKGTFVKASTYAEHLDPMALRYYYASKLGANVEDIDLNLEEFSNRVNAELVNKVVNLASRSSRFLSETGLSAVYPDDGGLFAAGAALCEEVEAAYRTWNFAKVTRLVTKLADKANEFVDKAEPWAVAKRPGREADVQAICTVALNLFWQLAVYLGPITPRLATMSGELLGESIGAFAQATAPIVGKKIGVYQHLMKRVEPKNVSDMIEQSKVTGVSEVAPAAPVANDDGAALEAEPLAPTCTLDDLMKGDLRVARIVSAEAVPEAKKLLKLTVSLGGDVQKTIFAGIKAYYQPETLIGRLIIVCANLEPRQMKFGLSEGMALAAGGSGEAFLLSPDSGAKPGQRVH